MLEKPLYHFQVLGRAVERGKDGTFDHCVAGDPCIVWDNENEGWLMYYFASGNEIGSQRLDIGMAVSNGKGGVGPGEWKKLGKAEFQNPGDVWQESPHKPWILMDPYEMNRAAKVDGTYRMFFSSKIGKNCVIQQARSESLYGPWNVQKEPVLCPDSIDGFDSYHTDTVTAYWFEKKKKILLYYKGYPQYEQKDQSLSPFGSCVGAALLEPDGEKACKLGKILTPVPDASHWASGWVSTLQLLPRRGGGWLGLLIASPTPPMDLFFQPDMREPNPSLGGWAYTEEDFPVQGWKLEEKPIKWIQDLTKEEIQLGERVYLFRHHLLYEKGIGYYLFYNSGAYGDENMFVHKGME